MYGLNTFSFCLLSWSLEIPSLVLRQYGITSPWPTGSWHLKLATSSKSWMLPTRIGGGARSTMRRDGFRPALWGWVPTFTLLFSHWLPNPAFPTHTLALFLFLLVFSFLFLFLPLCLFISFFCFTPTFFLNFCLSNLLTSLLSLVYFGSFSAAHLFLSHFLCLIFIFLDLAWIVLKSFPPNLYVAVIFFTFLFLFLHLLYFLYPPLDPFFF